MEHGPAYRQAGDTENTDDNESDSTMRYGIVDLFY